MLNNIFDSHAHYADSAFDNDRERLLKSLPQKGVSGIVTVGSNMEDSYKCVEIAEAYDYAYGRLRRTPGIGELYFRRIFVRT